MPGASALELNLKTLCVAAVAGANTTEQEVYLRNDDDDDDDSGLFVFVLRWS